MRTLLWSPAALPLAAAPAFGIIYHAGDNMDHPLPKAPLSQWTAAPGCARITLAVLRYEDPKHTYRMTAGAAADDDAIPPTQGPRLEQLAASPDKRFIPIVGAKHDWLLENPQSQVAVATFLAGQP